MIFMGDCDGILIDKEVFLEWGFSFDLKSK